MIVSCECSSEPPGFIKGRRLLSFQAPFTRELVVLINAGTSIKMPNS
jgi:hypothetical protein